MTSEYVAGSCNIGKGEIRRRQLVALFGIILTISSATALLATDQSRTSRISIFLPALVFSVGYVQSRSRFCLAYGFAGTFNFDRLGKISRVQSEQDRKADRKTALVILLKSAALAALITAVFIVLPL